MLVQCSNKIPTNVYFSHDQLVHIVDRVVAEADVNEVFDWLFCSSAPNLILIVIEIVTSPRERIFGCLAIYFFLFPYILKFMCNATILYRGAAVAQWIRSRLPSCRPGFESQAHHLCFFQFKFEFKL